MASIADLPPWMIYTDADNTLWDTNAVFAEAQIHLLERAEIITGRQTRSSTPLEYLRQYDQAIAKKHHLRLRYPPALLIRALIRGLQGEASEHAAADLIANGAVPTADELRAVQTFEGELSKIPQLLPGVRHGLQLAHDSRIPVYVVTEGPADATRKRLRELSIEKLTSGILSATKTRELYLRLAERATPSRAIMIGDQPDRDIRLAHEAGLKTILILGSFRPKWLMEKDSEGADATVPDFLTAIRWVIEHSMPTLGPTINYC
jgi:putative hydrolase of the HAD superfamily